MGLKSPTVWAGQAVEAVKIVGVQVALPAEGPYLFCARPANGHLDRHGQNRQWEIGRHVAQLAQHGGCAGCVQGERIANSACMMREMKSNAKLHGGMDAGVRATEHPALHAEQQASYQ